MLLAEPHVALTNKLKAGYLIALCVAVNGKHTK